jgi:GNAT superfamily N-acetyltransferase
VRLADEDDFVAVESIENSADSILIDYLSATMWWPAPSAAARAAACGFTLLAVGDTTDQPVGFAHVVESGALAHLEQLSVLPGFGRLGYGRQLVLAAAHEARLRGYTQLTLRTFADVPWNAPFYRNCGFITTQPATDFHRGLVATEEESGLPLLGQRVQMTLNLV